MSTETQNTVTETQNPVPEAKISAPATPKAVVPGAGKKKLKLGKFLGPVALVALLGGCLYVFLNGSAGAGSTYYQTFETAYRDLEVIVSDSGTVEPADSYTITALVSGEVLTADFSEGDWVEEDDLLYTIDAGDLDIQIEQAQLNVRQAELSYSNIVTNLTPSTTAAGRVKTVYVEVGDAVSAGSAIATLASEDGMTITLPFHRADALNLAVGDSATLTLEGNMEQITGTVTKISWEDISGTGGAIWRTVEISVENPGGISTSTMATATVGGASSVSSGAFAESTTRTVYAAMAGTITSVLVDEGDWVGADTKLCVIGGDSVSSSLAAASLSIEAAQLSLESIMDMLDNYEITAPISGTVIDKELKVGDNVEATSYTTLAVIYDMSYLTFTLNIDELDVNKLAVGQTVRITSDAISDQEFTGIVDKVSINGTTMSGVTTYPVTVLVEESGSLLPGMNVSADILISQVQNVLTIPVDAVSRGNTVQVLPADGYDKDGNVDASKLQTVTVELGESDADYIQVLSGLNEGDIVVVATTASNFMDTMAEMGGDAGPMMGS